MTTAKKLTGAQRRLLVDFQRFDSWGLGWTALSASERSRVEKLISRGLIEPQPVFPSSIYERLHIADAGRKALEEGA